MISKSIAPKMITAKTTTENGMLLTIMRVLKIAYTKLWTKLKFSVYAQLINCTHSKNNSALRVPSRINFFVLCKDFSTSSNLEPIYVSPS